MLRAALATTVLVLASCSPHHESGTERGCLFGAYASPRGGFGASREEATLLELEERIAGRRMDLDRIFRRWDDAFPGEREARTLAAGRIPVVSFTSTRISSTSPPIPWAAVARGEQDAHLEKLADAIAALGRRVFFMFHAEPEDAADLGTPDDYRAAVRRMVAMIRARDGARVTWIFNAKSSSYPTRVGPFYPGDDVVDWIGVNAYNFGVEGQGDEWLSLRSLVIEAVQFAQSHGKPVIVSEWSTVEDPADPNRKVRWLDEALTVATDFPEIRAMSYLHGSFDRPDRRFQIDTSPAASEAFRRLANAPLFTVIRSR